MVLPGLSTINLNLSGIYPLFLVTSIAMKVISYITLALFIALFTVSCHRHSTADSTEGVHRDLGEIRERGKLVALTDFNSTNYFIYRGEPMGFQFELLHTYADHLGLELEIITENDLQQSFDYLQEGRVDLLAINLAVTRDRMQRMQFTEPITTTRQVLVQRKPDDWRKQPIHRTEQELIRNQLDLAGKRIYVQANSSYAERLRSLSEEIGDSIDVVEVPMEAERLVQLVAQGEMEYTVCDENVARVNSTYYPQLDVSTPVSFPQKLAWAVRKEGSEELLEHLNEWILGFHRTTAYGVIYNKYFRNSKARTRIQSDLFTLGSGRVSPYDEFLREVGDSLGWDWRLLASLIYQESRFRTNVQSWAGAYGLMQLMPSTAAQYGVERTSSPEDHMLAGIQYLQWLDRSLRDKVPEEEERIKFVLAAYNVGLGHVLDARRLAAKNELDPSRWDDHTALYLLKKSDPEYYHDPVVEYGYCRGEEPYQYVKEVLARFEHYKNIIPES